MKETNNSILRPLSTPIMLLEFALQNTNKVAEKIFVRNSYTIHLI